jgi:hypothetical protein
MSVPVSRILFIGSDHSAEFAARQNSNRFGFAESATIHLGPALPRDLGAAYLGSDLAETRIEAGNQ